VRYLVGRVLILLGLFLVQAGKVLAGTAAIACPILAIVLTIKGHPQALALIFPGAPFIAGTINFAISGPGWLLMRVGAVVYGPLALLEDL
jgi:hypothetical protein